ncbi:hypothetical protein EH31_08355 [Erythrobacter longus]|uniref:DUF1254 domain-containing protein n=1 Tax=Erythrobacter longus TaxID=1044 RepID=A0A074M9M3_ERYLO|nr:DUF1254 domain-containing protein [Erythrobacter longus]KEO90094.1 hypothetical protein EH31_08355 [Erythrobacter longus]
MRGWIGPTALAAVTGIAAHFATLALAPNVIMDQALFMLAKRNIALHSFTNPERITPQTQVVVCSSPDLFYALCRYDLTQPGSAVRVTMGDWPGYQSLSFFDASTNNFATVRGQGVARTKTLLPPDMAGSKKEGEIVSPSERGVVLIRRLAPTQELFDQALEAAKNDRCEIGYS